MLGNLIADLNERNRHISDRQRRILEQWSSDGTVVRITVWLEARLHELMAIRHIPTYYCIMEWVISVRELQPKTFRSLRQAEKACRDRSVIANPGLTLAQVVALFEYKLRPLNLSGKELWLSFHLELQRKGIEITYNSKLDHSTIKNGKKRIPLGRRRFENLLSDFRASGLHPNFYR
jgi:hypothetical protein